MRALRTTLPSGGVIRIREPYTSMLVGLSAGKQRCPIMSTLPIMAAAIAICAPTGVCAKPIAVGSAPAQAAFWTAPVSDHELATNTGTALPNAPSVRLLSNQYQQLFLQQVGADSRIALDNWFAQTGAALVANNVLSTPVSQ